MNAKATFAQLCRQEIENGLSPEAAFKKCRCEHREEFVAILTATGKMSRSEALAFVAQRDKVAKSHASGGNGFTSPDNDA